MSSSVEPSVDPRGPRAFGEAPMRWAASAAILGILGALLGTAGCYQAHPCDLEELCDGVDQDCDGLIDETFIDDDGYYFTLEHCGGCGVSCPEVFPTAAETACIIDEVEDAARCELLTCPEGFHRVGAGACAPDVPVLCLPCTSDADCVLRAPGAACLGALDGGGRCAPPCGAAGDGPCPAGSACDGSHCVPPRGDCSCTPETLGLEIACLVDRGDGYECAGAQVCTEAGFEMCEPALEEVCNGADDDCDRGVDEDFRDDAGLYVARLHCGACGTPCVEPGPHMVAICLPVAGVATCDVSCEEGFVDVDRIAASGCECERWDGIGPPPMVGGDADCDGVPDDTTDFVYVTSTGSDTGSGSLADPVRTLARAVAVARAEGKAILVARGIYAGPFQVPGGVDVFGGYRPDFADRDLELYPVLLETTDPGGPVLVCDGVTVATRIEGFILSGSDATAPGSGATSLYSNGCSGAVIFAEMTILAGRGADGVRGDDSSDNLADWGLGDLRELDGANGESGVAAAEGACRRVAGGVGGAHSCPSTSVSGGGGGAAECPSLGCVNGAACGNAGCTDFTVGGVCDLPAAIRVATANPRPTDGRGPAPGAGGALTYSAPTNRGVCNFCDDNPTLPRIGQDGGDGTSGADGGAGVGCAAAPLLDSATGRIAGAAGTNGFSGGDGSGGGGASPGAGYSVIGGTVGECADRSGGAGGGGGSGGCGAPGADAGSGGGTSAAVVIRLPAGVSRGPAFVDVRVVTASGGTGGDGGIGASGGSRGIGGIGGTARFWCSRSGGRGGDGGGGGAGGGGGGGCGGGSHGFYVSGGADPGGYRAELVSAATIDEVGVFGRGGLGGFSPGSAATDGRDGSPEAVFLAP